MMILAVEFRDLFRRQSGSEKLLCGMRELAVALCTIDPQLIREHGC